MLQDPSCKKVFMSSPYKGPDLSPSIDSETLDDVVVTKNETMNLQLSVAEKHERYILFEEEPRVLILYCSGSFGCYRVGHEYMHDPDNLEKQLRSYTTLCDKAYTNSKESGEHWIYAPISVFNKRVRYRTKEIPKVKPSSDTDIETIIEIGKLIQAEYYNYEAFIILHGTDTISFTAPALSFMLENLRKTVIITACLIPLCESRNDANNNLVASLTIAGHYWIPEVCVYFGGKLHRGNRIIKDGTIDLKSIKSPNFSPLAKVEAYINIKWQSILYCKSKEKFQVSLDLERNLSTIAIFPFMTVETFSSAFAEDVKGVVIETYGSGNFPSNRPELREIMKKAIDRGVIVVNVSQCRKGDVSEIYEGAVILKKLGVVNGLDMTMECALAKLSYLLGKKYPLDQVKTLLTKNLRGEITNASEMLSLTVKSPEFVVQLSEMSRAQFPLTISKYKLLPSLLDETAALGQMKTFEELTKRGYKLDVVDYEGRSPLHIAAIFNKIETAKFLIQHGLDINALDSNRNSPLYYAIKHRNYETAIALHELGGKVCASEDNISKLIMNAAYFGKIQRLIVLDKCGLDFNITDRGKHTIAHQAALNGKVEVLKYVAKNKPGLMAMKDAAGKLPIDYITDLEVKSKIQQLTN